MNELVENCKKLGLKFYTGTIQDDLYLMKWWMHLYESKKDINKLFRKDSQSLHKFLQLFQQPNVLIYVLKNNEITLAAWYSPFELSNDCTYLSAWTHEKYRGTRFQGECMHAIYEIAFSVRSVIIGITKQPDLLPIHRKIGYNILGRIPRAFDGEDGYIMTLTKKAFENGHLVQFKHKNEQLKKSA